MNIIKKIPVNTLKNSTIVTSNNSNILNLNVNNNTVTKAIWSEKDQNKLIKILGSGRNNPITISNTLKFPLDEIRMRIRNIERSDVKINNYFIHIIHESYLYLIYLIYFILNQAKKKTNLIDKTVLNYRNKWSEDDHDILIELRESGIPIVKIAEKLGRNLGSITSRLKNIDDGKIFEFK